MLLVKEFYPKKTTNFSFAPSACFGAQSIPSWLACSIQINERFSFVVFIFKIVVAAAAVAVVDRFHNECAAECVCVCVYTEWKDPPINRSE